MLNMLRALQGEKGLIHGSEPGKEWGAGGLLPGGSLAGVR